MSFSMADQDTTGMTPMEQWRRHILQRTLWTSTILASVAYVTGVFAAFQDNLWQLIVVNTISWGLLLTVTLWKTLDHRIRVVTFISVWYAFSAFLLWLLGPMGAGVMWLLPVPIFSALFFGYKGAWSGTALLAAFVIAYPFLPVSSVILTVDMFELRYPPLAWFAVSGSLLFLSCLVSLAIAELLAGLQQLLTKQEQTNRQLEELLNEQTAMQEELVLNRKQSALGTLAGGIAHDFNNLLVPIMMASEAARDRAAKGSEQQRHLDTVLKSAERARNLIRRILRFSQNVDVEQKLIALQPVVDEAFNLLRSSAGKHVHIDYRNNARDAHIMGDEDAVHQIIMNLGTNALLALPADNARMLLDVRRNLANQTIEIEISDNGPGIPEAIQDRIFDPYFTTRSPGTGTGLGLAIVHRLTTTALNGRIVFNSSSESGTTFIVSLPEVPGEISKETGGRETTTSATDSTPGSRGHIVVVDDEEMVRATLEAILLRENYRVKTCASPESALAYVHDNPDDIDAVITDLAMPGMTGLKLAEQLRKIKPELRIILVSGYLTDKDLLTTRALGISDVLEKPFRREQILNVLA